MVLEIYVKLCVTARFSLKKILAPKIGKMDQNWAQNRVFFVLLKHLVINFHKIQPMMKTYFIYCVPAQILYLGKVLFLRYRLKFSQPIRLQYFFNQLFLQNKSMK